MLQILKEIIRAILSNPFARKFLLKLFSGAIERRKKEIKEERDEAIRKLLSRSQFQKRREDD